MIKIKQEQARSNRITTVFSSTPCSIQGQHKDSKLLANFLLWYIILLPDTSRQRFHVILLKISLKCPKGQDRSFFIVLGQRNKGTCSKSCHGTGQNGILKFCY